MKYQDNQLSSNNLTTIGRRRLLQALVASSGSVVINSSLSGQWIKPIIEFGQLPAHAQGSGVVATATPTPDNPITPTPSNTPLPTIITISDLTRGLVAINNCTTSEGFTGNTYEMKFGYIHSSGKTNNLKIRQRTVFLPSNKVALSEYSNYTLNNGIITYNVCTGFGSDTSISTTVTVTDSDGIISNELVVISSKPVGASSLNETSDESK